MTALDKLRELLATRPAMPNVEELTRWWRSTGLLLPQLFEDVEGMDSDIVATRAALRSEQDARAKLRVGRIEWQVSAVAHLQAWRGLFDAAVAMREGHEGCVTEPACGDCFRCRFDSAVDEAMKAVAAGSPDSVVAQVGAPVRISCAGHVAVIELTVGEIVALADFRRDLDDQYSNGPFPSDDAMSAINKILDARTVVDAGPPPCCPSATLPGGKHDIGCRGTGKVH